MFSAGTSNTRISLYTGNSVFFFTEVFFFLIRLSWHSRYTFTYGSVSTFLRYFSVYWEMDISKDRAVCLYKFLFDKRKVRMDGIGETRSFWKESINRIFLKYWRQKLEYWKWNWNIGVLKLIKVFFCILKKRRRYSFVYCMRCLEFQDKRYFFLNQKFNFEKCLKNKNEKNF